MTVFLLLKVQSPSLLKQSSVMRSQWIAKERWHKIVFNLNRHLLPTEFGTASRVISFYHYYRQYILQINHYSAGHVQSKVRRNNMRRSFLILAVLSGLSVFALAGFSPFIEEGKP